MGTLRITGVIDISQFWPNGTSDADTTKIRLLVNAESFMFRSDNEQDFVITRVYEGAKSKGKVSKEVINSRKSDNSQSITVRLQGLDAPELHYKAAPLKKSPDISQQKRDTFNKINEDRRQCFAETATNALAEHLKDYTDATGFIGAVFETNIENPQDAVDTYGRFVGNIFIDNLQHELNIWLIENGWGIPAFYTSMNKAEIQKCLDGWKKGSKKINRVGKAMSTDANIFDWELLYRKPKAGLIFVAGSDHGAVIMPKIYRRQVSWKVAVEANIFPANLTFTDYLKTSKDELRFLDDFLKNGKDSSKTHYLHEIVKPDNTISMKSEDIIFQETPSILINADGKRINTW